MRTMLSVSLGIAIGIGSACDEAPNQVERVGLGGGGSPPTSVCDVVVRKEPAVMHPDLAFASGVCAASLSHTPAQILDTCDDSLSSHLSECPKAPGDQVCVGKIWTVVCETSADCPTGTVCDLELICPPEWCASIQTVNGDPAMGYCVRPCDASNRNAQCGRCDLTCESGWCALPAPARPEP